MHGRAYRSGQSAAAADAEDVAGLLLELGYPPSSTAFVREKLVTLNDANNQVFVAEHAGRVVGAASVHVLPHFHAPGSLGKVTTLVVSAAFRGRGLGRALLRRVESFARARGALRLEVISGNHRPEAHRFYERVGYRATPQTRFLFEVSSH